MRPPFLLRVRSAHRSLLRGALALLLPFASAAALPLLPSASLLLSACEDPPARLDCGALPEPTACPLARGGACTDRECSAIYDCTPDGWSFLRRCEGAAGTGGGSGTGGAASSGGAPFCEQITRDPSCVPLQPPDCDVAAARGCPTQACVGSCEVFFACRPGGWSEEIVGFCDEAELVLADP